MAAAAAAAATAFLLSLLAVASATATEDATTAAAAVGGRTDIKDVGSNKEVQSLGRFAVAEHNRRLLHAGNADPAQILAFTRVVAAQKQVVEGVAYYLKVIAGHQGGGEGAYDAEVVVKAWLKSKELVSFTPSPK